MYRPILVLVILALCLSQAVASLEYPPTENWLFIGGLRVSIKSPSLVEPEEYFTVNILIHNNVIPIDLDVDLIQARIEGGGIDWQRTLAENITIKTSWQVNETAIVKTQSNMEGRKIELILTFDFQDNYYDSYYHTTLDVDIAQVKYREQIEPPIQALTLILATMTAILAGTSIYFGLKWRRATKKP